MNFDKYKNPLPYPNLPNGNCPKCQHKVNDSSNFCGQCGESMIVHHVTRREAVAAYEAKSAELDRQFIVDALAEVGLRNHPKKDAIYWYAYERGHGSGYGEIFNVLLGLAELFRE